MSTQNTVDQQRIMGHVKWFDPLRGLGFIVADHGGSDILLHANVLRNFGQGSVVEGSAIEIVVQDTQRGLQATQIIAITPPRADVAVPLREMVKFTPDNLAQAPTEPARAKWFDKTKGFGFANVFGSSEDVFIHVDVLRRSGLTDLQSGEAIGLRLLDSERGRVAIEVIGWDVASK